MHSLVGVLLVARGHAPVTNTSPCNPFAPPQPRRDIAADVVARVYRAVRDAAAYLMIVPDGRRNYLVLVRCKPEPVVDGGGKQAAVGQPMPQPGADGGGTQAALTPSVPLRTRGNDGNAQAAVTPTAPQPAEVDDGVEAAAWPLVSRPASPSVCSPVVAAEPCPAAITRPCLGSAVVAAAKRRATTVAAATAAMRLAPAHAAATAWCHSSSFAATRRHWPSPANSRLPKSILCTHRERRRRIVAKRAAEALRKGVEIGASALAEERGLTRDLVRQLLHDGTDAMLAWPSANGSLPQLGGPVLITNRKVRLLRTGLPQAWQEYDLPGHMCNAGYAAATMFKSSVCGWVSQLFNFEDSTV